MKALKISKGIVEEIEINGDLKSLQSIVGGLIEPVHTAHGYTIYCNEEGKLLGLEDNFAVVILGEIVDIVVGDCVVTGFEAGDTIELEDMAQVMFNYSYISNAIINSETQKLIGGLFI